MFESASHLQRNRKPTRIPPLGNYDRGLRANLFCFVSRCHFPRLAWEQGNVIVLPDDRHDGLSLSTRLNLQMNKESQSWIWIGDSNVRHLSTNTLTSFSRQNLQLHFGQILQLGHVRIRR